MADLVDEAGRVSSRPLAGMDTAKAAGMVVLAALAGLAVLRKVFDGATIRL